MLSCDSPVTLVTQSVQVLQVGVSSLEAHVQESPLAASGAPLRRAPTLLPRQRHPQAFSGLLEPFLSPCRAQNRATLAPQLT
jgi:hypothetical protein